MKVIDGQLTVWHCERFWLGLVVQGVPERMQGYSNRSRSASGGQHFKNTSNDVIDE